ncbi:hypothetical protein [Alterinioella nitratireducens]|uniref:hypothetical protein n=1 Tax=Alterinioella nitratireducens TaxID=2735915 RepID=UPI004058B5AE
MAEKRDETKTPDEKMRDNKVRPDSKLQGPHRHRPRYTAPEEDAEEELFNDVPV